MEIDRSSDYRRPTFDELCDSNPFSFLSGMVCSVHPSVRSDFRGVVMNRCIVDDMPCTCTDVSALRGCPKFNAYPETLDPDFDHLYEEIKTEGFENE